MKYIKNFLVFFFDLRKKWTLNRKIKIITKRVENIALISNEHFREHKLLWKKIRSKPDARWYKVYASVSGIDDPAYITEYDYYTKVEPRLNHRGMSEAFCDKNYYHRYIPAEILPDVYLRNMHGVLYDQSYNINHIKARTKEDLWNTR